MQGSLPPLFSVPLLPSLPECQAQWPMLTDPCFCFADTFSTGNSFVKHQKKAASINTQRLMKQQIPEAVFQADKWPVTK